jgi:hypothetical protein
LFANIDLDDDIKLASLCPKCREEVTSGNTCTRCGKKLYGSDGAINPNFDRTRFDRLNNEHSETGGINESFDIKKYNALLRQSMKEDYHGTIGSPGGDRCSSE